MNQSSALVSGYRLVDGRRVNMQILTCSYCGRSDQVDHSGVSSLPPEVAIKKFQQRGWQTGRKPTCPACLMKFKVQSKRRKEQMAEASKTNIVPIKELAEIGEALASAPADVRVMSAVDRRRIFRAIDDAWDESKGRYGGNATDHMIAETLEVPRAWVEEIRHESFGDAGDNDAIDVAVAGVQATVQELSTYMEQALLLASKFEGALKAVKSHEAALLKIRAAVGRR